MQPNPIYLSIYLSVCPNLTYTHVNFSSKPFVTLIVFNKNREIQGNTPYQSASQDCFSSPYWNLKRAENGCQATTNVEIIFLLMFNMSLNHPTCTCTIKDLFKFLMLSKHVFVIFAAVVLLSKEKPPTVDWKSKMLTAVFRLWRLFLITFH